MEINILMEEGIPVEPDVSWLQKVVEQTLLAENVPESAEVSLVITGQEKITELNRTYRGKDSPTDVLAFAMSEQNLNAIPFIPPPDRVLHLGEVLISYVQAEKQAHEQQHSTKKELTILAIHGVLHLLGYDDEKPEMKPKMQAREAEILSQFEKEIF